MRVLKVLLVVGLVCAALLALLPPAFAQQVGPYPPIVGPLIIERPVVVERPPVVIPEAPAAPAVKGARIAVTGAELTLYIGLALLLIATGAALALRTRSKRRTEAQA